MMIACCCSISQATVVTITPRFPFARAFDLLGRTVNVSVRAGGAQVEVALGPGDAAIVRFEAT